MNSSPTVSTTAEPLTSAIGIDMRYGIVVFSLFGLAIASTGCSRDAVDVDSSADAGRAIRFEGRCDDATRAVPGDPADGKVPVYWCDGDAVSVETFLLDFDGDLYDKTIRVEFCRRLRPERRFASPQELKAEIQHNIQQTRDYFMENPE